MSNVLSEEKKQQVIALGKLGWPLRRIEQATGVRRETAGAYLKAAGIAVRPPGGWGRRAPAKPANEVTPDSGADLTLDKLANSKPANEVTPDFGRQIRPLVGNQDRAVSTCEPYRELIEQGLDRGRNAKAIWQDLVSDHGFPSSYQAVKRFVRKHHGSHRPQPVGIILTAAGEEAQVDYGTGPMVRDAQSGKYRRTRLFVMTLGYSRKSVRLLLWRSSSRVWAELHEKAFRRLGGCPRVVVLDNLREGVIVADIYDPTLNPLFRDVLAHYGVVAMPCRIQDPDRKGKVESGVGHAQKTPLKGLRFENLEEAQAYLDRWETRWADTRIHGTTKRQVAVMFAEEKPSLLALALEPFRYYQYGERVVHLDGCVEVEAAYYGLPPGWIGRLVKVQWDALHVRIVDPSYQSTSPRAYPPETRLVSHQNRRLPQENAVQHCSAAAASWPRRNTDRRALRLPVSPARRAWHSPHPGCPLLGQEIWHGGSGRCLRRGPGNRCAGVSLRAPISRAPSTADSPASRSADP